MTEVIKVEDCGSNIGDYDIPIHNAIIIPRGATNGDMIKALFPNCVIDEDFGRAVVTNVDGKQYWRKNWWNAPYKTKSEG